ncbi:outer membrane beta-barrel protein [Pseudomaricurvus alcaniphilus]|uniref:outer membrane beta-barrel protein n=1 Tax=Pseudomaricurvus alcaniphilus TaxID=1166482 RepID=UPI0014080887|nr:outer membrane beta-barrel protein [Pseudomaricurvus alcaniphilus]NHN36252.1 outer membrane beta-barrel protein [Pseudomaricurvus alcaniphilus]
MITSNTTLSSYRSAISSYLISALTSLTFFVFSLPNSASAEQERFYVGVSAGFSMADVDKFSEATFIQVANHNGANFTATGRNFRTIEDSIDFNNTETSLKLFAGYRINEYLDAEIMYVDLGSFERIANRTSESTFTLPLLGTFNGIDCVSEHFDTSAFGLSLLAHTKESISAFSFFAKIGISHWKSDVKTQAGLASGGILSGLGVSQCDLMSVSTEETGSDFFLGVGVRKNFGNWSLRAEVEHFSGIEFSPAGEAAIYLLSAGVEHRF